MNHDFDGRVDKLSEAVGVLSERITRVEDEQRAMRGSIDQLTGAMHQLDRRLDQMANYIDRRLDDFDKRLNQMAGQFDKRLDQMIDSFERRITDIKWVISLGMGLIVLLMTLYRFVQLPSGP